MASRNSSYPGTPPTSSGGQRRSPPRQTGAFTISFAGMVCSRRISCCQSSPKIISIGHRFSFRLEYLAKNRFAFIDQVEFIELVEFWDAPAFATLLELMKMAIGPAHSHLDCAVEAT